jgi:tRNA(fMet)-specific endonuclease VapC
VSLYLLDTDHLTLYQQGNSRVVGGVVRHQADELAISVITVTEQLTGWQTALQRTKDEALIEQIYIRMAQTVESLATWKVLHFPTAAMRRYNDLKRKKLNVGSNDLKIAAIALEFNAIVVTRNQKDFGRIPGIRMENWAS